MKTNEIKINAWYQATTKNGDVVTGFAKEVKNDKVQFVFIGPNRPWIDAETITGEAVFAEGEKPHFSPLPAWISEGHRVSPWGVIASVERFSVIFENGEKVGLSKVLFNGSPVFVEDVELPGTESAESNGTGTDDSTPKQQQTKQAPKANNAGAAAELAAALEKMMSAGAGTAKIDEEQLQQITSAVEALGLRVKTLEEAAPAVVEHHIKVGDFSAKITGKVHELFDDVCACIANGEYAYIYGPAGTGKSFLAKQVADALGLDYYEMNKINESFELEGYNGPDGTYFPTPFYKSFKNGGLLLFDEFDGYNAEAVTFINNALANKRANFRGELVTMSPDFHLIAAGNTTGRGATEEYNTRQQIDAATMSRFAGKFEINYDPALELQFAENDKDLIAFVYDLRRVALDNGLASADLGGRVIRAIKKWCHVYSDTTKAVKYALRNGQDADTARILANGLKVANKYATAYKTLCA